MTSTRPRVAIAHYDRTAALESGAVEGAREFEFVVGETMGIIRGLLEGHYDAGEMSLSAFVKAREIGRPLRALPIFTKRRFFQQYIYTAQGSDIHTLEDLKGRRVGVYMYWMTSSIWHRRLLRDEVGLDANDLAWTALMAERMASMRVPEGVTFDSLNQAQPNGLIDLLLDGRVDCVLGAATTPEILAAGDRLARPFENLDAEQRHYYARTRIFPIVHLVVCRERFHHDHARVERLRSVFERAKESAYRALEDETATALPFIRSYLEDSHRVFGRDPYVDGVEPNRHVLDAFLEASWQQGLTARRLGVDELF